MKDWLILRAICQNISIPVHQRYRMIAELLPLPPPVLKTDLWNELRTPFPIPADAYIEIDPAMVEEATQGGLNAFRGSITGIPFPRNAFRSIIDLSTLDHVENPLPALKEYHRLLEKKNGSVCRLVCWTGALPPQKMANWDGYQYYFPLKHLISLILKAGFMIIEIIRIEVPWKDEADLVLFELKPVAGILRRLSSGIAFRMQERRRLREVYEPLICSGDAECFLTLSPEQIFRQATFNRQVSGIHVTEEGLSFNSEGNDPWLILPGFAMPDAPVLMVVAITSRCPTALQVYYRTREKDHYCEEQQTLTWIRPGRQTRFIMTDGGKMIGRLRIDPAKTAGNFILHRIDFYK